MDGGGDASGDPILPPGDLKSLIGDFKSLLGPCLAESTLRPATTSSSVGEWEGDLTPLSKAGSTTTVRLKFTKTRSSGGLVSDEQVLCWPSFEELGCWPGSEELGGGLFS